MAAAEKQRPSPLVEVDFYIYKPAARAAILVVAVAEQVGGDGCGRLGQVVGNNDDNIFP